MRNKINFGICYKEGRTLEEKKPKRNDLITIEIAIKYAKASVYALQNSATQITPKDIGEEMKMHYERYNDKMVSILLKAYEQEEKKKC